MVERPIGYCDAIGLSKRRQFKTCVLLHTTTGPTRGWLTKKVDKVVMLSILVGFGTSWTACPHPRLGAEGIDYPPEH